MASVSTPVSRIAAPIVAGILFVAALVLMVGIYIVLPQNGHFSGLVTIGVLSLVFAAISYLAQSLSAANPAPQRTLAWAFYAFGFALLLVTFAFPISAYALAPAGQVTGLVLTLVALAGSIAGIAWRSRTLAAESPLAAARVQWQDRPPVSAFNYGTARSADAPATAPPPSPPKAGGP